MPRVPVRQTSFAAGEFDPKLHGRSEVDAYGSGAAKLENSIAMVAGGCEVRPGTWRLETALAADGDAPNVRARAIPFQRSALEGYVLELTSLKMRIWSLLTYDLVRDGGGDPVILATPWDDEAIRRLMYGRNADVMFIADAANEIKTQVLANTLAGWTLNPVDFRNGPWNAPAANITLTVSGASLTASADIFDAGHVGAQVWIKQNPASITTTKWEIDKDVAANEIREYAGRTYKAVGAGKTGTAAPIHGEGTRSDGTVIWQFLHDGGAVGTITAVTDGTHAAYSLLAGETLPAAATSTPYWHIQAFNDVDGWPACLTWHQERVFFGGTKSLPDSTFFGQTNGYDSRGVDFKAGLASGLVVDSDGGQRDLSSGTVDPTAWMLSADDLIVGGAGGVRKIRGPGNEEPITPAGAIARGHGAYGAERGIAPIQVGDYVLYIELGGRRLRGLSRDNQEVDLSILSEHLLRSGIDDIAWESTTKTLWLLTNSGDLLSFVYDQKQSYQSMSPHVFAAGRKVETIALARRSDGFEALWLILAGVNNQGDVQRDMCVMTRRWDTHLSIDDTCYLDMAGYFDATIPDSVVTPDPDPDTPEPLPTTPPQTPPDIVTGGPGDDWWRDLDWRDLELY